MEKELHNALTKMERLLTENMTHEELLLIANSEKHIDIYDVLQCAMQTLRDR